MTMLVKMEMVSDGGDGRADGHCDAAADGDDNYDVNMNLELWGCFYYSLEPYGEHYFPLFQ